MGSTGPWIGWNTQEEMSPKPLAFRGPGSDPEGEAIEVCTWKCGQPRSWIFKPHDILRAAKI